MASSSTYAKLKRVRAARGDRSPILLTRPHLPSWRHPRDTAVVQTLRPIAARSAPWLALQIVVAFKQQLNLDHTKTEVVVTLPDKAILWEHLDRAIELVREKGYVVQQLTKTVLSFDATKATK